MKQLLLFMVSIVAWAGIGFAATDADGTYFEVTSSNISGPTSSTYAAASYEDQESGIKLQGWANINNGGFCLKAGGGYMVTTANPKNCTITKVVAKVKTGSAQKPGLQMYKASEQYSYNSTAETITSLSGTEVSTFTLSAKDTEYTATFSIGDKFFGMRNSTSQGVIIVLSLKVYYEMQTGPVVLAKPVLNITEGCTLHVGDAVTATSSTSGSDVSLSYNLDDSTEPVVVAGDKGTGTVSFTIPETWEGKTGVVFSCFADYQEDGGVKQHEEGVAVTVAGVEAPLATITDVLELSKFKTASGANPSGTNYTACSYASDITDIVYSAEMAAGYSSMQLNTSSPHGIWMTKNDKGYILKEVAIEWESHTASSRKVYFYGKDTAYASGDLFDTEKKGTELGHFEYSTNMPVSFEVENGLPFIGITPTGGAAYISKITLTWMPGTAPEPQPAEVSLSWGDMDSEYTVGQKGVTGELTVDPEAALGAVTVTSSNPEAVKAEYDAETGLVELTMLAAAEEVTLTATIPEGNKDYVAKSPATVSFKVKEATVEPVIPGQVTCEPEPENDTIEAYVGTKVTFHSENAVKLWVEVGVNSTSTQETIEGDTYVYTVTEDEAIISVVPMDSKGSKFDSKCLVVVVSPKEQQIGEMVTSTATFDFAAKEYTSDYNSEYTANYIYQDHDAMTDLYVFFGDSNANEMTRTAGTGWTIHGDKNIQFIPYFSEGEYEVKSVAFYGTVAEAEVTVDGADFTKGENCVYWNAPANESLGSREINISNAAGKTIAQIEVEFEHEAVMAPELSCEPNVYYPQTFTHYLLKLSHPQGHGIYVKKTDAESQNRSLATDSHAGHEIYSEGDVIELHPGETISYYAQHPHGMVSGEPTVYSFSDLQTSVGSIIDSEAAGAVRWFNLQGQEISEPNGVCIRVQAGKAVKTVR